MFMLKKSATYSLAAGLVALAALTAPASAQNPEAKRAGCDTYARVSEVQAEANHKYGCDIRGPEWTTSRHTHFEWCMRNRRDNVIDQLRYRMVELQKCFNNLGDYDDENWDRSYRPRF